MDGALSIISAYAIYWYLVLHFGDLGANNKWYLTVQANIGAIICTAVQFFYARRIYVVSHNIFLPTVIVILCIAGNAIGYYIDAKQFAAPVNGRYPSLIVFGYVGMGETVLVDVIIASAMCWALYRKKTGFARTDSIIMTLMTYTINTGLLTGFVGVAMLTSFIIAPASLFPVAIFWILCKCYINSMLVMLNSREHVRDRSTTDNSESHNSFNLTSIRIEPPYEAHENTSKPTDISFFVQRSDVLDPAWSKSDPS